MLASTVAAVAAAGEAGPLHVEGAPGPRVPPPAAAPLAPPSVLRLVWLDPAGVGVGAESVARDETRSLLVKMGAAVSWRHGHAGEPDRPGEVRVILLDRAAATSGKAVLGATPSRFDISPFVWVHVPSVRAVVGLDPAAGRPSACHCSIRASWRSPSVESWRTSWARAGTVRSARHGAHVGRADPPTADGLEPSLRRRSRYGPPGRAPRRSFRAAPGHRSPRRRDRVRRDRPMS